MRIIAGRFKGKLLAAPKGTTTRPTRAVAREALFDILVSHIPGAMVLDAFAGSGALGLESISRGAARVTFIDKDRAALAAINQNISSFGVSAECAVMPLPFDTAVKILTGRLNHFDHFNRFDIIMLDPPYDIDKPSDLLAPLAGLLAEDGIIAFEHSKTVEIIPPSALTCVKEKKYGDAMLSFFILLKACQENI
ncbi:methyltransferase [Clostridia bacterium]|nr:methyltransferase [Clostridia bacterium]